MRKEKEEGKGERGRRKGKERASESERKRAREREKESEREREREREKERETFSHFLLKFSTFSDRPGSQDRASSTTLVTTIIINLSVYNHPSPLQAPDQCCPPRAASQRSPQLPTSLQPSILRIFSPTAVFIYNSFILTHSKKE